MISTLCDRDLDLAGVVLDAVGGQGVDRESTELIRSALRSSAQFAQAADSVEAD